MRGKSLRRGMPHFYLWIHFLPKFLGHLAYNIALIPMFNRQVTKPQNVTHKYPISVWSAVCLVSEVFAVQCLLIETDHCFEGLLWWQAMLCLGAVPCTECCCCCLCCHRARRWMMTSAGAAAVQWRSVRCWPSPGSLATITHMRWPQMRWGGASFIQSFSHSFSQWQLNIHALVLWSDKGGDHRMT